MSEQEAKGEETMFSHTTLSCAKMHEGSGKMGIKGVSLPKRRRERRKSGVYARG